MTKILDLIYCWHPCKVGDVIAQKTLLSLAKYSIESYARIFPLIAHPCSNDEVEMIAVHSDSISRSGSDAQ